MDALTTVLTLPMSLAAVAGAHVLVSRAAKAVAWSASPLSAGEPQAFTYERNAWRTAETQAMQVVAAVAVAGLVIWVGGVRGSGWILALGVLLWAGAVGLDLLRWQRVAVSANFLWYQRGLRQTVHQIAFENIRDVAVEERDARGFTLAHGTRNRVCRLQVRMKDKRIVALPKTDAHAGLADVEAVANQLRLRLSQLDDRTAVKRSSDAAGRAAAAVAAAPAASGEEADLRRALRRLRKGALAPDVPQAVKLPHDA